MAAYGSNIGGGIKHRGGNISSGNGVTRRGVAVMARGGVFEINNENIAASARIDMAWRKAINQA